MSKDMGKYVQNEITPYREKFDRRYGYSCRLNIIKEILLNKLKQ